MDDRTDRATPVAGSRINRNGIAKGTKAPCFTLPGVDGSSVSLAQFIGRRVLLVFSAPECPPCVALAPRLEAIHRERAHQLTVLVVSRCGLEATKSKAAQLGLTYPIAVQRHWEISRAFGTFFTPSGYLIDEEGTIASALAIGQDAILALAGVDQRASEAVGGA